MTYYDWLLDKYRGAKIESRGDMTYYDWLLDK
jgi:hypothetical protein